MKEKELPVRNEAIEGYEDLEGWYEYLVNSGKQVQAIVYNKPFEKITPWNVMKNGELVTIKQARLRVWVLLDDNGAMEEVSIKKVDVTSLDIKRMQRDSKEMEDWLRYRFEIPVKPKGPYDMSSVPVKNVVTDNYEEDSEAKRIWKLNQILGFYKVDKEHHDRLRAELEGLVGVDTKEEGLQSLCTREIANILNVSQNIIRRITDTSSHRLFSVEEDLSGVRSYNSGNIPHFFGAIVMKETEECFYWKDVDKYVRRGFSKDNDMYFSTRWRDVQKRAKDKGIDLSDWGKTDEEVPWS